MKKLLVLALALFALSPVASAQVATVLMTVDAVNYDGWRLSVSGVPQGEASPTSVVIQFSYGGPNETAAAREFCQRLLLLALSKPGQYLLRAGPNTCRLQVTAP